MAAPPLTSPPDCCPTKVVSGAPDPALDGEYLLREFGLKREEACVDGCVYERSGDQFCFMSMPEGEGADVVCQARYSGVGPYKTLSYRQ